MAVEQMKYISIMGPLDMFNEFVLKHIINCDIQLEPSYKSICVPGLIPFEEDTSMENLRKRIKILNEKFNVKVRQYDKKAVEDELLTAFDRDDAEQFVTEIENRLSNYRKSMESLKSEIQQREQILKQVLPLANLDIDIDQMFHFTYMKFRFGFLPKENYNKQKSYMEELDVVVVPIHESGENLWLSYFMPGSIAPVIDNVFAALGFERVRISDQAKGTPKFTIERINEEIKDLRDRIEKEDTELELFISTRREKFDSLYSKVLYLAKINEVKRMCSHSRETFFLAGWIPGTRYKSFEKEVEQMERVIFSSEDPECVVNATPPTVLKNRRIFKPFEGLLTMYGLPSAREMDPTPFMMLTYVLMFGFMFGDVGQGAVIAALGFFLYRFKKMPLGGVMLYVGISSTIFGFIYGSVFGNEELIKPLWLSPLHGKDNINTLLYGAVGFGAFIIIVTIIANIINNIRMRKWGNMLFDKNGVAGLMFYGGLVVIVAVSLATGTFKINAFAVTFVFVIPGIMILFKEPLSNLIMKKDHILPHEKGIFFVEAGFDLFETLLSFFSSTISFARVGAFALNHAGLSLAVWTLYNMMRGAGGILVVIVGNAITIGLEGLIVGIQCMRLEYYEMFGRFYLGEGHEFKPVRVTDD